MILALPFFLALLLSATLVPACRWAAFRLGYTVDPGRPGTAPKALFGGIAVALALAGSAAMVGVADAVPMLLSCSAVLFAVGLASDVFTLKPYTKLVAIIAVASVFLFFDYRLYWLESITLDSLLTLFWIVAVTSAFNLLDNMDGLCGGIVLIAGTAFLFTVVPFAPDGPLALQAQYLMALLGAVSGFLIYNVHPASIAMGESGSLMLGLNMAAMTLQFAPGRGSDLVSIIAVPVLLLLIPIVDATVVAISRLTAPPRVPAIRDHSSHRLVAMGLSERAAVGLLWVLSAVSGAIAVAAEQSRQGIAGVIAAMFTIAIILFALYLARVRVYETAERGGVAAVMPLGLASGYWRALVEVLLDLLLIAVAYYGAFRLRFDAAEWVSNFVFFRQSFPVVLGIQVLALLAVGAYRGVWRYFSLSDGVTFAKAVFLGVTSTQVAILYLYRFEGYSPAIFIVYGMFLLLLLTGSRASFRLLSEFLQRQRHTGRRLLIYGAGDAGSIAVRHLLNDARYSYRILGFIDDDIAKHNMRVHGYRVIGGYDHMVGMILSDQVDAVAITQDNPSIAALAALCAKYGVSVHALAIDFHDIPAAEPKVGAVGMGRTEARVLPITEGRLYREAAVGPSRVRSDRAKAGASDVARQAPVVDAGIQRIRVAHVITRLILGGAQGNTLATAIGQDRDPRFDVTLLCGVDEQGEGNMFMEATRAGIKTVVIPSLVRDIRPITDIRAFFDLYRFFKRGAFAIVHTHSSKAGIIGRLAARAAGVPVVVHTLHGLVFHEFQSAWKNSFYIVLKRICAPLTDRIISVSDLIAKAALARGIGRPDQHITIYSGIELERFLSVGERLSVEEAKRRVGISPAVPVVGKIARLFPLKGHEQFLAAAAEIGRRLPDVHFLLVGDGPLSEWVREEAKRLGLTDRLVMVGRVPPEDVPEYIQAMDVVVHTSLREGIARVLPEAGAVGKPVVTFELDGAPEVVKDGISGYLVRPIDTDAIAERTVALLRDPATRERFGAAGRAFAAEHFSEDRMVEQINDVYLELMAARQYH